MYNLQVLNKEAMKMTDGIIKEISTQELIAKIKNKYDFLLIDVNPKHSYDKHHIKESTYLNYDHLIADFRKLNVPREKFLVFYCEDNWCNASPIAAKKIAALGYTNVHEYKEGVQGWIKAGMPIEGT